MSENLMSIGDEIQNTIVLLLKDSAISNDISRLQSLKLQLLARSREFKLDDLVYGGPLIETCSFIEPLDKAGLNLLLDQLRGTLPYYKSYVFFRDFRELLNDDSRQQYDLLLQLTTSYEQCLGSLNDTGTIVDRTVYEDKMDLLYSLTYRGKRPANLPEFAIGLGCHILLSLPDPPSPSYNIQEDESSFSTILPVDKSEDTLNQLNYINSLLAKVKGEVSLYVDIQIVSSGYVFNLR